MLYKLQRIASIDFYPPYILSGSSDKHIRLFNFNTRRGWSTCPEFHNPAPSVSSGICEACGGLFREREDGHSNPRASISGHLSTLNGGVGSASRRTSMARDMHGDLVRSVALGKEFVVSASYDQSIKASDRCYVQNFDANF
jgi:F-box and WD-40 domain protein 1/11